MTATDCEGKVALITGAGSGMGRVRGGVVRERRRDVSSSPTSVDERRNATVEAIRAAGGDATYVRADVSKWADCEAMVKHATDTYGALHVLYNNAGIFPADDGGVLDTPESTWEKVMDINLKGVWLGCRAGIPAMIASGGGSIVNVASFVALDGRGDRADRVHREQGRRAVDDARDRGRVRAPGHPRQLAVPRTRSRPPCSKSCSPIRPAAPAASCTSRWAASAGPRSSRRPRSSSPPTTPRS